MRPVPPVNSTLVEIFSTRASIANGLGDFKGNAFLGFLSVDGYAAWPMQRANLHQPSPRPANRGV
jgi:hypothetical protein